MRTQHISAIFLAFLLCACSDAPPTTYAIATGGTAGLYYPFGGGMASIWSRELDGVNVKAEVTGGSVTNVIQVARGESEFGIAMADVVTAAYEGKGRFPEPLPLRILLNAYPNIVHILTLEGTGIRQISDLHGRRVSLGAAGSGTAVAAENVLIGLGLTLDALAPTYLNFGETTAALKDGTIDAGFVVGGLGLAAVTELAVTRDLYLIPLSAAELTELGEVHPAYSPYSIPGNTYAGVDESVTALGIWSAVVVHADMQEKMAFDLVCTLFEHRAELMEVSPVARDMQPENLDRITAVPLHPGTVRYLERGDVSPSCGDQL